VLERQSEQVRRLLLRTSVLERVSGELADLLAGGSGGERVLQELEQAGAFVVALARAARGVEGGRGAGAGARAAARTLPGHAHRPAAVPRPAAR
jgi:hypothetical protein